MMTTELVAAATLSAVRNDRGRLLLGVRLIKPVVRICRRKWSNVRIFLFLLGNFIVSLLAENILHHRRF